MELILFGTSSSSQIADPFHENEMHENPISRITRCQCHSSYVHHRDRECSPSNKMGKKSSSTLAVYRPGLMRRMPSQITFSKGSLDVDLQAIPDCSKEYWNRYHYVSLSEMKKAIVTPESREELNRRRRHGSDSSLVKPISDWDLLASRRIQLCISHDKLGRDVKTDNLVRDRVSQSRDENSNERSRPISHKGQKESSRKSSLSSCLLLQYWWIQQWYLAFCCWILPPRIGSTSAWRHSTASWRYLGPWILVVLCIISLLLSSATASHADLLPLRSLTTVETSEASREKVCQSVDIRNSVENLRELEDCTVVEGFVHIVLIEKATAGLEFLNHTYPKLREITGYLLLYRAFGLRSLRHLFPNLAVIRGQMLIFNHALVIYEMMQLQEIGLTSLTDIQRGGVLIEKNPNLCFVNSIDWDRIAKEGRGSNFIRDNKPIKECPLCPNHCPSAADGRKLCWTNDDCQKVCDECGNRTCIVNHNKDHLATKTSVTCCHEECLGGCNGTENDQCHVCKHVVHKNVCRATCPPSTFLFMKRRCVTDTECIQLPLPKEKLLTEKRSSLNWKPFGRECVLDCPPGFQQTQERSKNGTMYYTCKECQGPCPKSCPANLVSNIETAQQLKGCTKITGNLGIQIKGGNNIVRELEENLGGIEEIDGSLKIARSYSLLSLNFLKSLKVIHGNTLEKGEYAVYVLDNENLQELWNWDRRSNDLVIERGKLFFHFNPKLCLNQIEKLNERTKDKNYTELDVSPTSNGDKAACNEQTLTVNISKIGSLSIAISWENYKKQLTDPRALLGYVISYIEAPHRNVTFYDGRDACGGDGWKVNDVTASDSNPEFYLIPHLKPFTQYALYVRTYTVAAEVSKRVGARSDIIYVRTHPDDPDKPDNLVAYANSSSELVIEWKPPKNQNGIVTHYIVYGIWRTDDQEYVDKQDYCQDISISVPDTKKSGPENRTTFVPVGPFQGPLELDSSGQQCCSCSPQDNLPLKEIEKEQQFRIKFENHLHNAIYVKQSEQTFLENQTSRLPKGRRAKREGNAYDNTTGLNIFKEFPDEIEIPGSKPPVDTNDTLTNTYFHDRLKSFKQEVNDTRVTIRQLRHFAEYTIKVEACHDPEPGKPKRCSKSVVASARTKNLEQADDIVLPIRVETFNQTISSVKVSWEEPSDPNGLIVKYRLEYKRVDLENVEPQAVCIRRKDFIDNNKTRILRDLAPGNYSFRVRSHSLAGPGRYTPFVYFYVQQPSSSIGPGAIAGVFVMVFLFCVAIGGIGTYYLVKKRMSVSNAILYASVNPDYMSTGGVYIPDDWEVARENVKLDRELGQGSFGTVYEGIVRNVVKGQPEAKCAVKTVNECASIAERIQFLNEASVMKEFNTHHVVKLLGVVSKGQPTLVIMELMANGDLKTYLRSHRPDCEENISEGRQPPTLKCILKMAIEIADGMAYLAEKKFIHRDLAARNCMVAEDLTVKIGDFGMTRDIYETDYYRKGGKGLLPVRWMAPESLRDGVFTTQCDVWSYGVVLWEMATLASQPYQGLSNEQVLKYVMDGGVMEKPEGCPDRLYQLMEMCWRYQPRHRPTFLDIIEDLLPDVPVQFASVSFFHTDAGVNARAAQRSQQEQEYRILQDPSTPLKTTLDSQEAGMSTSSPVDNRDAGNHRYSGDQILSIDDDDDDEDLSDGRQQAAGNSDVVRRDPLQGDDDDDDVDEEEEEEEFRSNGDPEDDHVPVIFPNDRRPYILIRDPAHAVSNGSKSDSSKGTTIPSEDSKGSYVSNGSASNGYVLGILKQRHHNSAEC